MLDFLVFLYRLPVAVCAAIPTLLWWIDYLFHVIPSHNQDIVLNPKPKKKKPTAQAAEGGVGSSKPSPEEAKETTKQKMNNPDRSV